MQWSLPWLVRHQCSVWAARMQVPITYIWSPSLVPRPSDWGPHCEVVGFVNVELQKLMAYTPPQELSDFLAAGERSTQSIGDEPTRGSDHCISSTCDHHRSFMISRLQVSGGWSWLRKGLKGALSHRQDQEQPITCLLCHQAPLLSECAACFWAHNACTISCANA